MLKGLRSKLIILTIVAILPSILFIYNLNINAREIKKGIVVNNLTSIANLYSSEHKQIVENARHLLVALSVSPEINTGSCSEYLSQLLNKYQRYSNFAVADKYGNVYCSAVSNGQKVNIKDTIFFSKTLKTKSFSVGEYRISPTTNSAVLSFGYPYNSGVIYSSIELSWLNDTTRDISSKNEIDTIILDANGTILARYPNSEKWIGTKFPDGNLMKSISGLNNDDIVEDTGVDGLKRTYAFKKIGDENDLYVAVGIPTTLIFKDTNADFIKSLIFSTLILLFSFIASWFIGTRLIVKEVKKIEELNNLKDDFIYLVSHQIRTPLTSIKWFSEILLSKKSKNKNNELLLDINKSANRVIKLVSVILDISKIESGRIKIEKEKVYVKDVVNEVIFDLQKEIGDKNIKIKKFLKVKIIEADLKFIKQVYQNLIGNAVKYSHKNGVIEIHITKSGDRVITRIIDFGIGIPKDEDEKIFTKFSRGSNAIKFSPDGSGIGLYLVKLIAVAHGGFVKYKPNIKAGSIFIFAIPVKKNGIIK